MKRILFLDFDGTISVRSNALFEKMDMFCDWLRKHPTVDVVFSTAWRVSHTLDQLKKLFPKDVHHRFISCTPETIWTEEMTDDGVYLGIPLERQNEIERWISSNIDMSKPFKYAILDDAISWFEPDYYHLVPVNYNTGIVESDLVKVNNILEL